MAERAQVGDLIRIVNADDTRYKNGDILEVADMGEEDVGIITKDDYYVLDEEYVIHRKASEEDDATYSAVLHSRETVLNSGQAQVMFEGKPFADMQEATLREDETQADAVSHPSHYTQGRFETIEIIEEITQGYGDGYVAYCVGNALKYLARAPFKHESPSEDIAKARAYLDFAIKRLGDNT